MFCFLRFASTLKIRRSSNLFIPNSLASIPSPSQATTAILFVLNSLRTLASLFCTLCLSPNLSVAVFSHAASLHAQRILVNRDNFLVRQNRLDLWRHRSQIISRDQRRRKHRPQTEMRAVLDCRHSSVAHFEHVRIVPVSRPCRPFQSDLHIHNVQHSKRAAAAVGPFLFSFPVVIDVACGPPQIPDVLRPLPWFRRSPFAHIEYDRASRRRQRLVHRGVSLLSVPRIGAAPVILQIIDAPPRVLYRVLKF